MSDAEASSADTVAEQIAARGRDALVARLRAAYTEAASAHADILTIDEERIEVMVQRAADRADGLQWRRALAEVAAEELGISLTEALSNPAVARAQELVGAPSYEESLAALIASPVPSENVPGAASPSQPEYEPVEEPDSAPEPVAEAETIAEAEAELEAIEGTEPEETADAAPEEDGEAEPMPEAEVAPEDTADHDPMPTVEHSVAVGPSEENSPGDESQPLTETTAETTADTAAEEEEDVEEVALVEGAELPPHVAEDDQLRVSAVHLGGVANLPVDEDGLDLRLSSSGLDIMHETDEIIGRLLWSEIDDLEVPETRGRFRRSGRGRARLTVRTQHGDASFEVPAFSSDELRDRIDELLERYGR